jgi:hypothetical protein
MRNEVVPPQTLQETLLEWALLYRIEATKMPDVMIAQQELHHLLNLPLLERLRIAQRLIESAVEEAHGHPKISATAEELSPAAKWLLSMAGRYSGGPGNTAEHADEICLAEADRRSGFTTKPPLEDEP